MVKNAVRKLYRLLRNAVVLIAGKMLRKSDSVVLIGAWMGEKFADNSRFLFQYLWENRQALMLRNVVWATHSEAVCAQLTALGYHCVQIGTRESFYWHCKAGIHVICNVFDDAGRYPPDIDTGLSAGARKIQLWHGNGIKRVDGCMPGTRPESKLHKCLRHMTSCGGWTRDNYFLLCKADIDIELFRQKFGVAEKWCIDGAYPRTTRCLQYLPEEEALLAKIKNYRKTIMYLPTFREQYGAFRHPLEDPRLLSYLETQHILWIEKPHGVDSAGESVRNAESGDILTLDGRFDINVLMPRIDLLITDYSSAMLDAMYFYKPIVYYTPDFSYYIRHDRGFLMDYDSICITPKVTEPEKLMEAVDTALNMEAYTASALAIRSRFWKHADWTCKEIWEAIRRAI